MECLNKDAKKKEEKYDAFCICKGRDNKIATGAPNFLILCMEFYEFHADLIEAIN